MKAADRILPSHFPYARFALIVFIGWFAYATVQITLAPTLGPENLGFLYALLSQYTDTLTAFGVGILLTVIWTLGTVALTLLVDRIAVYAKPDLSDGVRYTTSLSIYVLSFLGAVYQSVTVIQTLL